MKMNNIDILPIRPVPTPFPEPEPFPIYEEPPIHFRGKE
jgi:hypothetical protein